MLIALETLAVLAVFVLIAGGFVAWRLYSGPVDIDYARPYIESALEDSDTGLKVSMDKIVLYWPELRGPLLLGFKNSRVFDKDGNVLISVDEAAIGLSKTRLLLGRVVPLALILKKPMLRVIRTEGNDIDIALAGEQAPVMGPPRPDQARPDPIKQIIAMLAKPENAQDAPSALAFLRTFRIEGAQVVVDDRAIDTSWTIPRLDLTLERDRVSEAMLAKGAVFFTAAAKDAPALKVDARVDLGSGVVEMESVLEYFEPKFIGHKVPQLSFLNGVDGVLNAMVKLRMDADQNVLSAAVTALAERGSVDVPELSPKPVPFSDLGLVAKYDGESRILEVTRGQLTLNDTVEVNANAELNVGEHGTVDGPVRFEIEKIAQGDIGALWPEALREEAAYEWVVHKISKGVFSNAYAQLDLKTFEAGGAFETQLDNVVAGFDFTGMDIDYRAPLKPVTGASGSGRFDMKSETLTVDVTSASMMDMQIPKAQVVLKDIIQAGKGHAEIAIQLAGPVKSALTFLKDEPIAVQTPIDVANAEGNVDLDIRLAMPAHRNLKMSDVGIEIGGTLKDLKLPKVVRDLTLSGGPLALKLADNKLSIEGEALLDGQAAKIAYEEFLSAAGKPYSSKISAKVRATPEMRGRMGIDLSLFMEGDADVDVAYTEHTDKTAEADVKVDIAPSRIFIEPFDYVKEPGQPGSVRLKALLKDGFLHSIEGLSGEAPSLTLETTKLAFRRKGEEAALESGKISRFTLGETVAALKFDIAQNGFLKIVMDGPYLDLRPFLNNQAEADKPYTAPPMQISVAVDRMKTNETDQIQYAKIYSYIDEQGRFNQLELDGIAGKGDLYVRYKPDETGKRTFRLEAEDAGATLKAFGVYQNIVGGKLVIYGEPIRGVFDRSLKGRARMTDFKVVKAPLLGRLLGLMSLTGVTQALNNEGLVFSKLESRFDWLYRPGGSLLVLRDGRTSGNAVGLTFDGTFDNAAQAVDVQGTIIPLSGVNKIIGNIPLVGDLLTGGTGSLIAATYSMKGKGQDISTFVNPLSVLTPGILRRILFEGDAPGKAESKAANGAASGEAAGAGNK